MRKSTLADYLDQGRCPIKGKEAGHTGSQGRCPKCELHLRNKAVRAEVEEIVKRRRSRSMRARASPTKARSQKPKASSLDDLGAGVPIEHDGVIWWFDRGSPGGSFLAFFWNREARTAQRWSAHKTQLRPPQRVQRGIARENDQSG